MTPSASVRAKIPTKSPQPARGGAAQSSGGRPKVGRLARGRVLVSGTGRAATRGGGPVIELECGVTVYPARGDGDRWRAVWYENGQRRQCEAVSEDLIAYYLLPGRLPVRGQWSRKHAHTQRRL